MFCIVTRHPRQWVVGWEIEYGGLRDAAREQSGWLRLVLRPAFQWNASVSSWMSLSRTGVLRVLVCRSSLPRYP